MSGSPFMPGASYLRELPLSAGPLERRAMAIGPFPLWLQDLEPAVAPHVDERFRGFYEPHPSSGALRLSVRPAGVKQFMPSLTDENGVYVVRTRAEEGNILVYGHAFAGYFEKEGSAGVLALCAPGWSEMSTPLENFLRLYCSWRAIDRQGFVIHAASVVHEGRAYVFFGHSGAGKTTASRFSLERGATILSDDLSLITLQGGAHRVHTVPFRGTMSEKTLAERKDFPLAGIYRLVQSHRNRVERMPHPLAVAEVVSCLPFVTDRMLPRRPSEIMTLVEEALRKIPVYRLELTRSPEFWDPVLESAAGGAREGA